MAGPLDYVTAYIVFGLATIELFRIAHWALKRMPDGWRYVTLITAVAALIWGIVR